jgi:zinc finger protein
MAQPNPEFFPTIGEIADKTDLIGEREYQLPSQDDQNEERPLEEIESLCMSCGEQVSIIRY